MRNKPPYAIASVDSALLLAALLQQEGPLRVTDAAERLGVSVSTAHRLLAMLVYRDFAEQQEDRRYRAGRVLREAVAPEAPVAQLRQVALPYLRDLVDRLGETVNVMVLAGNEVRFVATAECDHVLRVGDRTGRSLPAHLASGGKAILAALGPDDLTQVLGDIADDLGEDAVVRLRKELNLVRRRGFAVNDQSTEAGLTAVGVAIPDPGGTLRAAVSIAVPTVRYSRDLLPVWTAALSGAAAAVGSALARP